MGRWKIIDNYREQILEPGYKTEKDANDDVRAMIAEDKLRRQCYDYDVKFFEKNETYEEYINSITEG